MTPFGQTSVRTTTQSATTRSAVPQPRVIMLTHLLREHPDGVKKVIRALSYQRTKYPKRKRIGEVLRTHPVSTAFANGRD